MNQVILESILYHINEFGGHNSVRIVTMPSSITILKKNRGGGIHWETRYFCTSPNESKSLNVCLQVHKYDMSNTKRKRGGSEPWLAKMILR